MLRNKWVVLFYISFPMDFLLIYIPKCHSLDSFVKVFLIEALQTILRNDILRTCKDFITLCNYIT